MSSQSKDNTREYKIGDQVRTGRHLWQVFGYVGSKYILERRINYGGEYGYIKTIRKVRSGWRLKRIVTRES